MLPICGCKQTDPSVQTLVNRPTGRNLLAVVNINDCLLLYYVLLTHTYYCSALWYFMCRMYVKPCNAI